MLVKLAKCYSLWCQTLYDCMDCSLSGFPDCSLLGSPVHGILQARILEWVAILFSRGSAQPEDWTQVSCIAGRFFTIYTWTVFISSKILHSQLPKSLSEMFPWLSMPSSKLLCLVNIHSWGPGSKDASSSNFPWSLRPHQVWPEAVMSPWFFSEWYFSLAIMDGSDHLIIFWPMFSLYWD